MLRARQRGTGLQKKLVEKTSLHVYNLLLTNPQEALAVVQQSLEQMPGEPGLISLQEKAVQQIKKASTEESRTQCLKRAQAAIDARQFDQAIQLLENAAIEVWGNPGHLILAQLRARPKKQN